MQLEGTNLLITGAASGIGAALARRFAAEGATSLLLADLDTAGVEAVAAELDGPTCRAVPHTVDVGDRAQVEAMVRAGEALGPIDLLCSNAGLAAGEGLDADDASWDLLWQVNVMAQVHAAQAALPAMLERGRGYLLHTASAAGLLTTPGDAPYTATKHAAVGFAEWLAITYGDRGIGVSCLCPQGVATPLLLRGVEEGNASALAVHAAAELLQPEDVADTVVAGLAEDRFLLLPHADVAKHAAFKGADRDKWIATLRRALRGSGTLG